MKTKILLLTSFIFMLFSIQAQIIHVPGEYPTIQEGINASSDGDTVLVAENTYYENIKFMGKAITLSSEFIIDGNTDHINNTIIDGSQAVDPDSAAVVMFVNGEDTTSIINGFTITGGVGVIVTSPFQTKMGGGIFTFNSGAKISNNIISNNMVTDPSINSGGAGIGCTMEDGSYWVVIDDNIISNNFAAANAVSAYGGGVYVSINSSIKNNTIQNNTCYNSGNQVDGGGIEVEQVTDNVIHTIISDNDIQFNTIEGEGHGLGAGIMVAKAIALISGNTISNNSVDVVDIGNGGGIFIDNARGEVNIINNDITDNTVIGDSYGRAGGIGFWFPFGEIVISENNIINNTISTDGGTGMRGAGILFKTPTGKITVSNNKIFQNIAPSNESNRAGGGICLLDAYETEVIINANHFKNNMAYTGAGIFSRSSYNFLLTNNVFDGNDSYRGGGISVYHPSGKSDSSIKERNISQPTIINNTFLNNTADNHGGALYLQCEVKTPIIINSIFWENNANEGEEIYYWAGTSEMNISYCDIDPDDIYGNWDGVNNIYDDPGFIDTLYHISMESSCFNAGIDNIEIGEVTYNCPDTDFDGEPRPLYGLADIGADEVFIEGMIDYTKPSALVLNLNNYPNPFASTTTIEFEIPDQGHASVKAYDLLGKEVDNLFNGRLNSGNHSMVWDATHLQPGIYYLKVSFENNSKTIKLLHIK